MFPAPSNKYQRIAHRVDLVDLDAGFAIDLKLTKKRPIQINKASIVPIVSEKKKIQQFICFGISFRFMKFRFSFFVFSKQKSKK